eukprot:TRINITY_DN5448_c3_g1_i1.p1 TRINITY_DN5448_c3_g1~~TRINITY_DN5448_c3_g1_i1.p1  ORF type:complete len:439 (+),score=96.76 TRINITY_DN5448_c3_g1_i1:113-1318(+)
MAVHRAVLERFAPALARLFGDPPDPTAPQPQTLQVVVIKGVKASVFQVLLSHIYSRFRKPLGPPDAEILLELSQHFELSGLTKRCQETIVIDATNVRHFLSVALTVKPPLEVLNQKCIEYLTLHPEHLSLMRSPVRGENQRPVQTINSGQASPELQSVQLHAAMRTDMPPEGAAAAGQLQHLKQQVEQQLQQQLTQLSHLSQLAPLHGQPRQEPNALPSAAATSMQQMTSSVLGGQLSQTEVARDVDSMLPAPQLREAAVAACAAVAAASAASALLQPMPPTSATHAPTTFQPPGRPQFLPSPFQYPVQPSWPSLSTSTQQMAQVGKQIQETAAAQTGTLKQLPGASALPPPVPGQPGQRWGATPAAGATTAAGATPWQNSWHVVTPGVTLYRPNPEPARR